MFDLEVVREEGVDCIDLRQLLYSVLLYSLALTVLIIKVLCALIPAWRHQRVYVLVPITIPSPRNEYNAVYNWCSAWGCTNTRSEC